MGTLEEEEQEQEKPVAGSIQVIGMCFSAGCKDTVVNLWRAPVTTAEVCQE